MKVEEILNKRQIRALEDGQDARKTLKNFARMAAKGYEFGEDRPVLICGDPGIGKTYLIKKNLNKNKIDYYQCPATSSFFGLAIHLAKLKYDFPDERVVVLLDDVAKYFKGDGLDILKRLFEDKILDYSVDWSRFLDTAIITGVIWFVQSSLYNTKTQLNAGQNLTSASSSATTDSIQNVAQTNTNTVATINIGGGQNNVEYTFTCRMTDNTGSTAERTIKIRLKER